MRATISAVGLWPLTLPRRRPVSLLLNMFPPTSPTMTWEPDKVTDNLSARSGKLMSAADLCRGFILDAAGAPRWGDNTKLMLARAASRLGITARQAKGLYYGEWEPRASQFIELQQRAAELREAQKRRREQIDDMEAALHRLDRPDSQRLRGVGLFGGDQGGAAPALQAGDAGARHTWGAEE